MTTAAQQNASTILDALANVAPPEGWTRAEIIKRTGVKKTSAGGALKLLQKEGSVEEYKNGGRSTKFRFVPDDKELPEDGDDNIGADDAAILAAEGMLGDDVAVPGAESTPAPEAAPATVTEAKPDPDKKVRKTSTANERQALKVAFDLADTGEEEAMVRKATAKIDEAVRRDALARGLKTVTKLLADGGLDESYKPLEAILTTVLDEQPKPERGSGGGRGSRGTYKVYGTSNRKGCSGRISIVTTGFATIGEAVEVKTMTAESLRTLADSLGKGELVMSVRKVKA